MKYFVVRGETRRVDQLTRAELRGNFLECSAGITHYELTGPEDGEVVVCAGSLTTPLFYWDQLVSELHARGFRTLTYSPYGRGYSDRVQATYDEALLVGQLADLTQRLDLVRPFHLVGASMGALVAMAFAQQHTAQVATLTLAGPAGLQPAPAFAAVLRNETAGTFLAKKLGSKMLDRHLSHNVRDPERSAELTAMVRESYRFEGSIYALAATIADFPLGGRQALYRQTGRSPIPKLLLWGDEDTVTPITSFDEVTALLAPVESHIVSPCGHMVPFEEPAEMCLRITAFVNARKESSR
ncbi:alpha/beta fold hydrolase [Nocardia kruczakiae]|uniref:alpha/beta fold hydrolase n=1 Tax=Nocardia kruczakiae TaxID=261477 RepID=UPI0007A4041C|nr:alpha/beta hydrolase [Nocardia kruczakiae]